MKLKPRIYLLLTLLASVSLVLALKGSVFSATSSDAIAVKVVPNPNHYSISRWYQQKGIGGSPQSLTVDGYEAIRNGRTIYINAASVDPSSKTISTNIYLISYNQDQAAETTDILSRIISHWKFNENLFSPGQCSVSSLSCEEDKDCQPGYACSNQHCQLSQGVSCLADSECPAGLYCDSVKAKITRDVKRLGMVEDVKASLNLYKSEHGNYPTLAAGTYIPNLTMSVWPSWKNVLLNETSLSDSYFDPINRLASCPGQDPVSCWNASTSRFYFPLNQDNLELPQDSYVFVYSANRSGSEYKLCSFMESGALGYDTSSHELSAHSCAVTGVGDYIDSIVSVVTPPGGGDDIDPTVAFSNHAPQMGDLSLQGEANQPFNGYIEVTDEDGDSLSWQLDTSSGSWPSWSTAPVLKDSSGNTNRKLVYASKAGAAGDYPISLTVSDNRGGIIRASLTIKIKNETVNFAPAIEASDYDYYYSCANNPLDYSFYVIDEEQPVTLAITKVSASPDIFSGITPTKSISGNRADFSISTTPAASLSDQDRSFSYNIKACDAIGSCSEKVVSIRLHPGENALQASCQAEARLSKSYYCRIGSDSSSCFNNMTLAGAPTGISLVHTNGEYAISGQPTVLGQYSMSLSATDSKGSVNSATLPLKVNTYCGDGLLQSPNSEGKGGPANNGYEQCDITANVATNVAQSSSSKQYGCVPDGYRVTISPYPIINEEYCVFGAKTGGSGGYCGDGYCQARVYIPGTNVPVDMESTTNCASDCGNPVNPDPGDAVCGNGQIDSGEACDGSLFVSGATCASVNSSTPYGNLSCSSCSLDVSGCSGNDPSTPVCGDGQVSGNESCDYASFSGKACSNVFPGTSGTLGCYSNCTYNSDDCRCGDGRELCSGTCCALAESCVNGSCRLDGGNQDPNATCGDGSINQSWEKCDGTNLSGQTCASINSSTPNGTLKCSSSCSFDVSGCSGGNVDNPICGNGTIEGTEQCDGTNLGGKTCATINPNAPNGVLKCQSCQLDLSGCSASTPTNPVCGNGTVESGEECDSTSLGGKTCASLGFAGGSLTCGGNCKLNTTMCTYYCPAGTKDGYVYNSFNNNETQSVTKNVCYRSNGGKWTATAKCSGGSVMISNAALACFDGYKHVDGGWYEENYGCYDACVYATCAAGSKDGYSYNQMSHKDTASVTRTIDHGSCAATADCSDGVVSFSSEECTCSDGYIYDANTKSCLGCINDSTCAVGYYCNIPSSSFYYSCSEGAENNTCQKKCWSVVETVDTFTFREGDIVANYGCSIKERRDDPDCGLTGCPIGCNNQRDLLGYTGDSDRCCSDRRSGGGCKASAWDNRAVYRCSDNDYVKRHYDDSCRLTLGSTASYGTMDANGVCRYLPICGNGICDYDSENCSSCSSDCGSCGYCGDGDCSEEELFDQTCEQDCLGYY